MAVWPIVVAGAAILLSLALSRHVVPALLKKKEVLPPWEPHRSDLIPFALGVLGMFISAVLATEQDASVWSYFIDTGSFMVGTSLFAVSKPKSWARIVGLLVVGIHVGQVLITNGNAPFYDWVEAARDFVGV